MKLTRMLSWGLGWIYCLIYDVLTKTYTVQVFCHGAYAAAATLIAFRV